jgi:S1-C subfamily serine protease
MEPPLRFLKPNTDRNAEQANPAPLFDAAHLGNHKVGDHVIAIGFPNLSQSQVLYDGFLSSMLMDIPHVIGPITGTPQFLNKADKMLRFQMPITPGASGSPLIDDNDAAIGVVAEMPVSRLGDLDQLITSELARPPQNAIAPNIPRLLAELAQIVYQEETPGTGLGVPAEYLLQRDVSPKAVPSGSPH